MATKFLRSLKPIAQSEADHSFIEVDNQLSADEADSDDDRNHSKLLDDISLLDPKKKKSLKWKTTRFEAKKDINEFNISKDGDQLTINDLLSNVKDSSASIKKLRHWHKKRLLDTPLEKPVAEKLKRTANYEVTSKDVSKWDPVVEANRDAAHLEFPLNRPTLALEPATEMIKRIQPKTKLELEVAELLNKSENNLTNNKALTVAEEKILKAMSVEEAKLRHKELQKMRVLLSYQEMKLRRQSKIKSKRYHRILKRERLKNSLKEFEESKKADPQVAIDKLKELEKLRALERASLKHRNTGKWAKHLKLRSKYDETARMALTEQLQINQKLLQKTNKGESDGEEEDKSDSELEDQNQNNTDNKDEEFLPVSDDYNPWIRRPNQKRQESQTKVSQSVDTQPEDEDQAINVETFGSNSAENEETNEQIDNFIYNIREKSVNSEKEETNEKQVSKEAQQRVQINPNDFISIKSHKIKSSFPDVITELDSDAESVESDGVSDDEQRKLVSEAFADDDIVSDFRKEKSELIENEKEKSLSLHLPGWGSWGGNGIQESKRKIRRFKIKGKNKRRKDSNLGNVIISEKKDESVAKYRVNSLPFPFKNVAEFEKTMAQPIGQTWNPEIAFRELTEPKVVTKMGTIIEPIDSDSLPPKQNQRNRLIQRVRKNKTKQKTNK